MHTTSYHGDTAYSHGHIGGSGYSGTTSFLGQLGTTLSRFSFWD